MTSAASSSGISADFPFESRYATVLGSKIHYVEEGQGDPILFLHGQPTSSYLWRNVIPHAATVGRAIALDLIGFGKSDKPDLEYRFVDHVKYVEGFIETLGLKNVTLVIHDWGSALGFHYAMRNPENVKGIAFMEAVLMPMSYSQMAPNFVELFQRLRGPMGREMLVNQNMFVEQLLPSMVARGLTEEEMVHYREPFTDPAHREPIFRWPQEVPIDGEPADVHEIVGAYSEKLIQSDVPKLLFHADPGAIVSPEVVEWCKQNLKNLETVHIGPGLHYLQEDNPELIGTELVKWIGGL